MYTDGDFEEVTREAEQLILEGNVIFQKWTCDACGERVTIERPNVFYREGRHVECPVDPNRLTNIEAKGCNYLMIQGGTKKGRETVAHWLKERHD